VPLGGGVILERQSRDRAMENKGSDSSKKIVNLKEAADGGVRNIAATVGKAWLDDGGEKKSAKATGKKTTWGRKMLKKAPGSQRTQNLAG